MQLRDPQMDEWVIDDEHKAQACKNHGSYGQHA